MFFVTSRRPTCPTSPKLPATVWPWIFAALAAPKIGGSLPHIHMVERDHDPCGRRLRVLQSVAGIKKASH